MATRRTTRRKPNILLIGIDSLRADHMSGYGYGRLTTPYLDRFAADGMPTGTAFVGQLYGEAELLAVAQAYQEATGFHQRLPVLVW